MLFQRGAPAYLHTLTRAASRRARSAQKSAVLRSVRSVLMLTAQSVRVLPRARRC